MVARLSASWIKCVVISVALIGNSLFAADHWIRLTSQNFDLYSSLNKEKSVALLAKLEYARQALGHLTIYATANPLPIRVIAFRSEEDFRPYASDEGSTAYYLHSEFRDYIVLGTNGSADFYTPAVHEYAHYMIHRQFERLPRWLDEGFADVYSTVEQQNGLVRGGSPPRHRR